MMEFWRPLVFAAALSVTLGIDAATAQSVIVRSAPPGSKVELVLNDETVGSAPVAAGGDATVTADLQATLHKAEAGVHVFLDTCPDLLRVLLVEGGLQPPANGAGCTRNSIAGLFAVRGITTFVVDVHGPDPAMWLRQGPAPPSWLGQEVAGRHFGRDWPDARNGLELFAGAGAVLYGGARDAACGTATACSGSDFSVAYRVGATYWIKKMFGAEVSYLKPRDLAQSGSGTASDSATYQFQNTLQTQMVTVTGNIGVPVGPVRIYGQAGGDYHVATSTTTETITNSGTQTLAVKTAGWGLLFGGGAEVWMSRWFAAYVEGGYAQLKGNAVGGGQGVMDDHVIYGMLGARVHIGR
jgi:hypothetical protein